MSILESSETLLNTCCQIRLGDFYSNFVAFSENLNYKPSKNLPLGWDKVEEVIGGGGGCCIRCPAEGCCC